MRRMKDFQTVTAYTSDVVPEPGQAWVSLKDYLAAKKFMEDHINQLETDLAMMKNAMQAAKDNLDECDERFTGRDEWSWITVAKDILIEAIAPGK